MRGGRRGAGPRLLPSPRPGLLLLGGAAVAVLLALGAVAAPAETPSAGKPPLTLAMVWEVPGRSPAFDPASVTEVLADYGEAHAVSATPQQLGRLRAEHFLVDALGPAKSRAGAVTPSPHGSGAGGGQAGNPPAYYAVELVAPPTPGWLARIEGAGRLAELASLDATTLVARLSPSQAEALAEEPFVASVAPFEPAKVHPGLRTADASAPVNVSILLFDPAAAPDVAAFVQAGGGSVLSPADGPTLLLTARIHAGDASRLATHPEVRAVEELPEFRLQNDVAAGIIGVADVWGSLGLTGTGQTVAVADSGLDTGDLGTLHPDFAGRIVAHFGYGRDLAGNPDVGPDPFQAYPWDDPHGHGTHVAGSVLGDGTQSAGAITGMAPDAGLVIQSLYAQEGDLVGGVGVGVPTLLGDAYAQGARISTNSWGGSCGNSCPYSSFAAAYDSYLFSHPDLLVLFAASNDGRDGNGDGVVDLSSLGDPAIAKNVLTVGASESVRATPPLGWSGVSPIVGDHVADDANGLAAFSGRGPTQDGRIKPDVVAPGTNILSTKSWLAPGSNFWGTHPNPEYAYMGGTSMATPIVAGSAALLREQYVLLGVANPSAALLKGTLIHTADDLAPGQYGTGATQEIGSAPDFGQGWGRVDVASAVDPPLPTSYVDRTAGLSTGQSAEYLLPVSDTTSPLAVTLAWTDRAGASNCTTCLVNNLNLVLVGPTGTEYHGNKFTTAIGSKATAMRASLPGATTFDSSNNVERIQLPAGMPAGLYTLRVQASSVPVGTQPFALLASGGFGNLSDVGVSLAASVSPPRVSVPYDVTVTVTNNGPDDAQAVTLTHTLPATMTPGTVVPSQGSCERVGSTVTCLLGPLGAGNSSTVTVPVTPTATGVATHTSVVSVAGDSSDTVASNDRRTLSATVVSASVNLGVAVTDSADPVLVGKPLAYTATVTNAGPDDAPGVRLVNTLPSAATYGTPVPSQGSCTRVGTMVTCLLGALEAGSSATVAFPLTPTSATTLADTATVALVGIALDPVLADNRATQATAVTTPRADLAVTNTDSADPLLAGQALTYTVTVTNNGPNDAPGVTLTDTLPSGMAYGTPVPSQGSCTRASTIVTCLLGPLANGSVATVQLPMTPTAAGTATNTASAAVTGGGTDPATANNRVAQATAIRAPRTDLSATNVDSADPLLIGRPLTYTVTVANAGPDDAPAVTLTDMLPSQFAVGSVTPSQGTCSRAATTVTCALGAMANGTSATVTIAGTTTAAATLSSTATVAAAGGAADPATGNNRAVQATVVRAPSTDLAVTQTDSADPVLAGDPLSYTVTVVNNGPDDAPAVQLSDTLPSGLSVASVTPSQGTCTRVSTSLSCPLGALANGASATVTIAGTPTVAGTFTSTASATAGGGAVDPATANNRAAQATTVTAPRADLAVANVDSADPVVAGVPYSYTVTVANAGPDDAPGVTLTDSLPSGMAYGTPAASQGTCTRSATTLTCLLGRLADGATATVDIQVTPAFAGTVTSTAAATVTGGGMDPASANNRVSQTTTVRTPSLDLTVAVADSPDPVPLGDWLTYTATVSNDGADGALGVTFRQTLPASTAFGVPAPSQGSCTRSSTSLTCNLGPMDSGGTATVTIAVKPSLRGTVSTTATVAHTGAGLETDTPDNRSVQATTVT